ncbi:MAG: hypothetical protein ACRDZQ_04610 [Acidimicrobiales bacterium]
MAAEPDGGTEGRPGTPAEPAGDRSDHGPLQELQALRGVYGAAPNLGDIPAATHWPSVPAVDAGAEWEDLRSWVEALQGRFEHLDHHVIPPCWWRHNGHVEALCALRDHERVSFSETAPATAALDWLRALRDVTALLRAWAGELPCGSTHQEAPARLPPLDPKGWEAHVASDVSRRQQAAVESSV